MALNCEDVRDRLPLQKEPLSPEVRQHVQECTVCRMLVDRSLELDRLLRAELVKTAPPDLTDRLLALIPAVTAGAPLRSKRWHRQRRIAAATAAVLVSISITLLTLGLSWLAHYLGADQVLATVMSLPGAGIDMLYYWAPASRSIVEIVLSLREPLQWIVTAALLWTVVEQFRSDHELAQHSAS